MLIPLEIAAYRLDPITKSCFCEQTLLSVYVYMWWYSQYGTSYPFLCTILRATQLLYLDSGVGVALSRTLRKNIIEDVMVMVMGEATNRYIHTLDVTYYIGRQERIEGTEAVAAVLYYSYNLPSPRARLFSLIHSAYGSNPVSALYYTYTSPKPSEWGFERAVCNRHTSKKYVKDVCCSPQLNRISLAKKGSWLSSNLSHWLTAQLVLGIRHSSSTDSTFSWIVINSEMCQIEQYLVLHSSKK
ncbi:hypothetical protein KQX54_021215 [Cotesia glomerata]|uniref:Uncharacterized protein n=1 Tax=Cotesia glomerata TaxID=32391 RepID=A0AAV7I2T8_COTGL|nr:hypothetical protein KQX54_021215 [Cotesia glomerata]